MVLRKIYVLSAAYETSKTVPTNIYIRAARKPVTLNQAKISKPRLRQKIKL